MFKKLILLAAISSIAICIESKVMAIKMLGNPILTTRINASLSFSKGELQEDIDNMFDTAKDADGEKWVGLAANQIGISKRIVIYRIPKEIADPTIPEGVDETVLIDPTYEPICEDTNEDWECFMSVPGYAGKVIRYSHIRVSFFDVDGTKKQIYAKDFHARVLQHEIDHLDGILYLSKIKTLDNEHFGYIDEIKKSKKEKKD
jgi:peptide deformylase